MTNCQRCARKSQTWLCSPCQTDLRDYLEGLALGPLLTIKGAPIGDGSRSRPWLLCAEDARYGDTRLGESQRRSSEMNAPLVVRLGPAADPTSATQWKDSPIETLRIFHGTLSTWIRHMCETRGVTFRPIRSMPASFIGPLPEGWRRLARNYRATIIDCAEWLAHHVPAIACDEACGELFNDVENVVLAIERMINRPLPTDRDLGPCPTLVAHHQKCAMRLSAPRKNTEVQCPSCKTLHRVDDLVELLRNELLYWPLSSVEIVGSRTSEAPGAIDYWNATLARSTFHYWRKNGQLQVRSYRNKTTLAIMPMRENKSDEPLFWMADVLDLMGIEWRERAVG